jgi:hypothetical protein
LLAQKTMINLFMDWRHNGVGRQTSEKDIKRQWKSNVRMTFQS